MEKFVLSSHDDTKISCYEWKSETEAKAVVLLVHGIAEHGRRYDEFAKFLTKNGLIVFASDHRAHGQTANGAIGITEQKDIFPLIVKDQIFLSDYLIEKYKKPLIVIGHSFGSFVTQSYLQNYNKESGIILSGSAYMKTPIVKMGKIVAGITKAFCGGEKKAKLIEKLSFGGYQKKFKNNGSWLSKNEDNALNYESDPECGTPFCANFYNSMFKNIYKLYGSKLKLVDKNLPILIASGKDDPVGGMGKLVNKLYVKYQKCGLNVQLKMYDGLRHEILNEKERTLVYNDFLSFINNEILKR